MQRIFIEDVGMTSCYFHERNDLIGKEVEEITIHHAIGSGYDAASFFLVDEWESMFMDKIIPRTVYGIKFRYEKLKPDWEV